MLPAILYLLSWFAAAVVITVGVIWLALPFVLVALAMIFYSTRGHRLGVRRNPRSPRGLWLERDAGVPADSS